MTDVADLRARATVRRRGNSFGDFQPEQVFEHHWGRTLTEADNTLFTTLTLSFNPLYFNAEYARQQGHRDTVVNPILVFLTVVGMSVEDLSEGGARPLRSGQAGGSGGNGQPQARRMAGGFIGVDDLVFHEPVYAGDTLTATSTVVAVRRSESRPGSGIVTWRTEGRNQHGALVISYERSNMMATGDTGDSGEPA